MSRTTVNIDIVDPSTGTQPTSLVIQLVGEDGLPVSGHALAGDFAVIANFTEDSATGTFAPQLIPNAEITPAGTAYKATVTSRGRRETIVFSVPVSGVTVDIGDLLVDVPGELASAALGAHLADTVDAHAASAVSFTPTGTVAATDVQAAVAEVASEATAGLNAHVSDALDAHAASAISYTPTVGVIATDVQAAIAEVQGHIPAAAAIVFYDVRTYGALGDGATDDRAAIQSAIDAASAAGGGIVFLPAGTYLIKRPLFMKSKVTLMGAGRGATTITKPASVKSLLTANASALATSVTVADGSAFAIGGPIHLYDTSSFEWLSTQGRITNIVGNVITFANDEGLGRTGLDGALQTSRTATATTSFPLLRNELASTRIVVRDLTLNQNQNANDPAPVSTTVGGQTDFTLATIHWVETYYSLVENCELINASGDAYSDQAQDGFGITPAANLIKTTKNTIRGCKIRSSTRHGVHIGTCMNGAFVLDNEITSCGWYGMFYCAFATNSVARGNLVEGCLYGFAAIDHRDYGNVIADNVIIGTIFHAIDAVASGSDGTGGRLVVTGNYVAPATGSAINIDQPDCSISGNTILLPSAAGTVGISLRTNSDRTTVVGNTITAVGAGSGSRGVDMYSGADDIRLIGNVVKGMQNGVSVVAVNRLVAIGNHVAGTARHWWFQTTTSVDCVIKDERNTGATPVSEDVAPTRLVYEGLGSNLTADPASSGGWNGITGRRYNGQLVRWNSGGGEKVSIFYDGVGWTALN